MGLSSAREKRRRSKLQEQGGGRQRIILRSRSNDQLPQRQDQPDYATPPTALMGRDSVSNTSVGGKAVNEEGEGESGKEEDEVMTLLDGTLHLPEPTDQYKEEWTPKEAFAADYGRKKTVRVPSGVTMYCIYLHRFTHSTHGHHWKIKGEDSCT